MFLRENRPYALRRGACSFQDDMHNTMNTEGNVMAKYGVGQPVRRNEDPRLLTGRGKFNDDLPREGEAVGYVLRSPPCPR